MKSQNCILILFSMLVLPTSCLVTYGDTNLSYYSALEKADCASLDANVHIFFEGEPLNFRYKKIGIVEAEGKDNADRTDLLNELKYQAWRHCANGIINIDDGYKERTEGVLFNNDSETVYSAKTYTGIAVQIEKDSVFCKKYGAVADTSYIAWKNEEIRKNEVRSQSQFSTSVILGAIVVLVVLIVSL